MKLTYGILLRYLLPLFFISLFFFIILIQIVDLFSNIVRYQNLEIPTRDIMIVQLLYLPKCISYALPIALLFSVAVAMSMLYANNELISILASGVPIYSFTMPTILIGIFFTLLGFVFDEFVVIETFRMKNELTKQLLRTGQTYNNSNVAVRSKNGQIVYYVDYYNDEAKTFIDLTIIEFSENSVFVQRIDADSAEWSEEKGYWVLQNITSYTYNPDQTITTSRQTLLEDEKYNISPSAFQFREWKIEEMTLSEAKEALMTLRDSGRNNREQLTDYYTRFSFAVTPIIVILISCSLAGKFKKNIILMSLLFSLCTAIVYYVFRSITTIMANNGILSPFVGAWLASLVFLVLGIVLYKQAPT